MMASHSCWVRPRYRALASTSTRAPVLGRRKSVALWTPTANSPRSATAWLAPMLAALSTMDVYTAVDHAPRGVVVLTEFGMVIAPRSSDFQRRGQPTEAV